LNDDYDNRPRVDAHIDEIPKWLHDNEYINTGYRIN
jgi:hypothetical protein